MIMSEPRPLSVGRRALLGGSLSAIALAAAGCSTAKSKAGAQRGSGVGNATNDGILTVCMSAAATVMYRNWNPYSPAANLGMGANWFYEPLVWVNHTDAYTPEPWLAKSWTWNDDYTTVTFTLRTAKWADGKPFTADDVVFSFTAAQRYKGSKLLITDYGFKSVEKQAPDRVAITFTKPSPDALADFGSYLIYPEHVLTAQKLEKWTNPSPVGTGPWTVEEFSPQQVTLSARNDYWGGAFPHVKKARWKVFANEDAALNQITSGAVDYGTMSWLNAGKSFATPGSGNYYETFPTGGATGFMFNCAKAPFNDVNVRRAFASAIDVKAMYNLYPNGVPTVNITGLSEPVWGDWIAPALRGKTVTQDIAAAQKHLAAGGWKISGGKLVKDGKSYPITFKTISDYTNWATWSDGVAQQLKDGLGLTVAVQKLPLDQFSQQIADNKFDFCNNYIGGSSTVAASCANPSWVSGAAGGYHNPAVTKLIAQMQTSGDQAEKKQLAHQLEQLVINDMPWVPHLSAAAFVELSGKKWTGLPMPKTATYLPSVTTSGPDTTHMCSNLRPAS
jgi:peptide/nickel transport system substrate-binding protein